MQHPPLFDRHSFNAAPVSQPQTNVWRIFVEHVLRRGHTWGYRFYGRPGKRFMKPKRSAIGETDSIAGDDAMIIVQADPHRLRTSTSSSDSASALKRAS